MMDEPVTDVSLEEIAQLALGFGFIPIPLLGKRPILPRWEQTTAATAMRKIRHAVQSGSANNIGIITGAPSGIVVVDIDVSRGGLDYWEELIAVNPIDPTLTIRTGSGGLHYYFLFDERTKLLRNAKKAIHDRGIDFKTTGGQVVFAGSIHPETGVEYDIIDGIAGADGSDILVIPMPDWLFNLLKDNQDVLDTRR